MTVEHPVAVHANHFADIQMTLFFLEKIERILNTNQHLSLPLDHYGYHRRRVLSNEVADHAANQRHYYCDDSLRSFVNERKKPKENKSGRNDDNKSNDLADRYEAMNYIFSSTFFIFEHLFSP
jgi:hypothetical protein